MDECVAGEEFTCRQKTISLGRRQRLKAQAIRPITDVQRLWISRSCRQARRGGASTSTAPESARSFEACARRERDTRTEPWLRPGLGFC
jgi:hypothetical protein